MSQAALYFLTGSLASGKTTLLKRVAAERFPGLWTGHVDASGSPGRGVEWVALAATPPAGSSPLLVVDGQERPSLMLEAARDAGLQHFHIVLVDCGHDERRRRLMVDRRQPEWDRLDTYAWAAYLRGQADALGLEIIDTTGEPVADSVAKVAASIERFAQRAGVGATLTCARTHDV
jgi:hypothetical protein